MPQARTLVRDFVRRIVAMRYELAKFGTVGVVSYGADLVVFITLRLALNEPLIAKTVAAILAGTGAFVGNRYWTWRSRPRFGLAREYFRFAIANSIGLSVQLACIAVSHYLLGAFWPEVFGSVLADVISGNVIGMLAATSFRFWAYRTLVFREEPDSITSEQQMAISDGLDPARNDPRTSPEGSEPVAARVQAGSPGRVR